MNSLKLRHIPEQIDRYGPVRPYSGLCELPASVVRGTQCTNVLKPTGRKLLTDVDAALSAVELRDGAVISFHPTFATATAFSTWCWPLPPAGASGT